MKTLALIPMALALMAPSSVTRPIYAGMPPMRFQQDDALALVIFADNPSDYCPGEVPEGYARYGCVASTKDGQRIIVMFNPCALGNFEFYAQINCHELAHYKGWPGDHPL